MNEIARFAAMMRRSAELKQRIAVELADAVIAVVDACETSLRRGGKLMFCGNGGSAADSQHLATELLIRLRGSVERASWPALALTLDPAALTAAATTTAMNSCSSGRCAGWAARATCCSASRPPAARANVVRALRAAREMGIVTVGLLGGAGEPALGLCDHALLVPDAETARIQECHIALGHAVLELLEDRLVARPL